MNSKKYLGVLLSTIGAVLGIVGTWILFVLYYEPYQAAMLAPPPAGVGTDAIIVAFLPITADFGLIAGVLYAISALGFWSESEWAFPTAVVANILALLSGFWPFIPAITVGQPPVFLALFIPNLLIYFILMVYVGDTTWMRTIVALTVGIAFVMSFMNGVASTNRILGVLAGKIASGGPIYVLSQRINWLASLGYAIATAGIILFYKKEWVRFVGLGAAILEILGGMPLAILNTMDKGELSMFFFAPILSLPLLVIFLWPTLWQRLVFSSEKKVIS